MQSKIMSKVFLWMFIGLAITFVTGSYISNNPSLILDIFKGANVFIIFILEFLLVIFLTSRIHKMSPTTARIMFIIYSFITGITFSAIFVVYSISSIIYVFLATAIIMLVFALIGFYTNIDLTKIGTMLLMMIIGILIMSIINIFIANETLDLTICIISIIVFVIYIAFDIQKVKQLYESNYMREENIAIYGALQLYLDFINIFIDLLRLFGDNK